MAIAITNLAQCARTIRVRIDRDVSAVANAITSTTTATIQCADGEGTLAAAVTGSTTWTHTVALLIRILANGNFRASSHRVVQITGIAFAIARGVTAVAIYAVVAQTLCVVCADFTELFLIDTSVATAPVQRLAIRVGRACCVAESQTIAVIVTTTTFRIRADAMGCTVSDGSGEITLCAGRGACCRTAHAVDAESGLALVVSTAGYAIEFLGLADRCVAPMGAHTAIIGHTTFSTCRAIALVRCTTYGAPVHAGSYAITIVRQLGCSAVTCG